MAELRTDCEAEYSVEQPTRLSQLVVETVADAEDVNPVALPPLYNTVDTDALDRLFEPQLQPASEPPVGEVQFSYYGYTVQVTAAGRVTLTDE